MTENEEPRDRLEDEEDPEEEERDPEPNGHAAPASTVPKQRRPRRGRPGGPPPGTGAWEGTGGKGTRVSAMEIWPDLLEEMRASGKTPYELAVRVVCEDPPPTRPIGNAFDASAIVGDRSTSPSDRLYQMVRDNYHMTWAKGPAIYDVQFVWKDGGKIARRGSLQMPHPDEIIGMKQIGGGGFGAQPSGYGQQQQYVQPQYGQPPAQQYGQPPVQQYGQPLGQERHGYVSPGQQYGQPWGQQPSSDESVQLRAELQRERENSARMQGQLDEILKAMREGRVPQPTSSQPVATPVPQPTPQQVDLDGVLLRVLERLGIHPGVNIQQPAQQVQQPVQQPVQPTLDATDVAVLRVLEKFGIKPGMPGIGVGAAPPSPKSVVDETDAAVNAFERMVTSIARVRGFGKKLDKIFSDDIPEVAAEVVEGAAEGKLPFDAVAIPEVKWADGRPVMYTSDKAGNIDWTAAAFSNPAVVEKVADGISKFMGTLGKVVQAAATVRPGVGEPEVVDETPDGTQDASGSWNNGMG
jgi:hypothetical protein